MSYRRILRTLSLGTLSLLLSKTMFGAVDGVVLTGEGQPVSGATVYGTNGRCCPFVPERVQTSDTGSFHLEQSAPVIHIWKSGFQPLAVVVTDGAKIKATLDKDERKDWQIPPCSGLQAPKRQVSHNGLRYALPREAGVKKQHSGEGYAVAISVPEASTPLILSWEGIIGSPHEDDPWILESTRFSERWIKGDRPPEMGIDAVGETKEGLCWRHMQLFFRATASYRPLPPKAAKAYDAIINSGCLASK